MKVAKQVEDMQDEEFYIEKILHLPSIVVQSMELMRSVPEEFDDFLQDNFGVKEVHESLKPILSNFDFINDCEEDEIDEDQDNLCALQDLWGSPVLTECQYIVEVKKAKRFYHSPTSWSSGGISYIKWFAAPTVDKALSLAKKYAKEMNKFDLRNMEGKE